MLFEDDTILAFLGVRFDHAIAALSSSRLLIESLSSTGPLGELRDIEETG